jgi:hypothetical protein
MTQREQRAIVDKGVKTRCPFGRAHAAERSVHLGDQLIMAAKTFT